MALNTTANITTGKPKTGGAIWCAPSGTALPTDATTALADTYVNLGYISENGVENDRSVDTTVTKAWGGDPVYVIQNGATDDYKFTMIESLNAEVLKVYNGSDNVSGTPATGMSVKHNSNEMEQRVYVIETIIRTSDGNGTKLRRTVIPHGMISSRESVTFTDSDLVAYGVTVTGMQDAAGNTSYEYYSPDSTD